MTTEPVVVLAPPTGSENPATDPRHIEFDLRRDPGPEGQKAERGALDLEIFYNICHGPEQVCQLMRRDYVLNFKLDLPEKDKDAPK